MPGTGSIKLNYWILTEKDNIQADNDPLGIGIPSTPVLKYQSSDISDGEREKTQTRSYLANDLYVFTLLSPSKYSPL